jgi:hypothetical protein
MSEIRRARVGIEKIWAYPGRAYLDLQDLARARGEEITHPTEFLHMDRRVVNPCWEDPITMAVNAAKPMLSDEDLAAIELSGGRHRVGAGPSQALTTFVQRFLGDQRKLPQLRDQARLLRRDGLGDDGGPAGSPRAWPRRRQGAGDRRRPIAHELSASATST